MTEVEAALGRCPVKVGTRLSGRYEVLETVARGNRGLVFLAQRCTVQRRVDSPVSEIIKGRSPKDQIVIEDLGSEHLILKVSDGKAEFRNEIWITANKLQHSIGAPEVKEVFPLVRQPWTVCVMECLGPSLAMVSSRYVKDEALCLHGIESLLKCLDVAHRLNIAHCDVQPSNICLSLDDDRWRLVDWGDAEHLAEKIRQGDWGSGPRGSCCYQAPEMLSDSGWGLSCDVWSLGIVLVEMYLGQVCDDEDHQQLFDFPDVCGRPVLEQMERTLGSLPDWLRGDRPKLDSYGDPRKLFERFPPVMADFVKRLLVYEPTERITVNEALLHPWFKMDDPVYWVDMKLKEAKAYKKLADVDQTCMNAAILQILHEGDYSNADRLLRRSAELRGVQLSSEIIGMNLVACFETTRYKEIDYWLNVLQTANSSLSEGMAFELVRTCARFRPKDAADFMYALKKLGTTLSSRMFTELIASATGPEKIMQSENYLHSMLKLGLKPESKAIVTLFEAYTVSYPMAQSNRRAQRYTIRSITPPPLATQRQAQSRPLSPRGKASSPSGALSPSSAQNRPSAMQHRQAENTMETLLLVKPPLVFDHASLEAMYAAVGAQRMMIFKKDPNFGPIVLEAERRTEQEVERQKEEAARSEEDRARKEKARSQLRGVPLSPDDASDDDDDNELEQSEQSACNPKRNRKEFKPFLRSAVRPPWITRAAKVTAWR